MSAAGGTRKPPSPTFSLLAPPTTPLPFSTLPGPTPPPSLTLPHPPRRPRRRGARGLLRPVERLGPGRPWPRQGGRDHGGPDQGALRQLRGALGQDARPAVDPAESAGASRHHAGR